MLILEDDDLKLNAVNTMDRVWSFLEMPKFDISRITNEDVHEK